MFVRQEKAREEVATSMGRRHSLTRSEAEVSDATRPRFQSSSGRKMCAAVQELQIGSADSRSPKGIGTRRSG